MKPYLKASALAWIVFTISVPAQRPDMHPDYPKVRKELVPPILAMKAGEYTAETTLPYRLFVPEAAGPENRLPLVVGLHGAGSRGTDNVKPMSLFKSFYAEGLQARHPCFVLAPQMERSWSPIMRGGFQNYSTSEHPARPEMTTLIALVKDILKEYPVDPNRIYLVGQSMGGYGTWDALVRAPDLWAAAVPICGGGDPDAAASFVHVPLWAWHGANDTTVPVENTRVMIEALKAAGGDPKYSEVNAGHGSWNHAFGDPDLYEWMFSQRRK